MSFIISHSHNSCHFYYYIVMINITPSFMSFQSLSFFLLLLCNRRVLDRSHPYRRVPGMCAMTVHPAMGMSEPPGSPWLLFQTVVGVRPFRGLNLGPGRLFEAISSASVDQRNLIGQVGASLLEAVFKIFACHYGCIEGM